MRRPAELDVARARAYRVSKAKRLRRILADRRWHTGAELDKLVGWRFGGLIHDIRRGKDGGPPWDVRTEALDPSGKVFRYRYVRELPRAEVEGGESWQAKALRLQRELAFARALLHAAGLPMGVQP